jgi:hypothetical protein
MGQPEKWVNGTENGTALMAGKIALAIIVVVVVLTALSSLASLYCFDHC